MISVDKRDSLLGKVKELTEDMRQHQAIIKEKGGERRDAIHLLREHGTSVRSIATEIGVSPQTIYNELEKTTA